MCTRLARYTNARDRERRLTSASSADDKSTLRNREVDLYRPTCAVDPRDRFPFFLSLFLSVSHFLYARVFFFTHLGDFPKRSFESVF